MRGLAKVCSWRALRFEVRRLQGPPTLIGPPLHGVGLSLVAQLLHCYIEWHGPQTLSERNLTHSRIDQDAPISFDVCNSEVKAARDFGGSGTLDLDCPSFPAGKAQDKVKFCPSRCPVEEGFRASGCGGDQGLGKTPPSCRRPPDDPVSFPANQGLAAHAAGQSRGHRSWVI